MQTEKDQCEPVASSNPKPNIVVVVDEYEEWCRPSRNTLIVNLLGKNVGLRYMSNKLQNLWAKLGAFQVMDMNNNFFLVWFAEDGDYEHALYEGPWRVLDHYYLVQQ